MNIFQVRDQVAGKKQIMPSVMLDELISRAAARTLRNVQKRRGIYVAQDTQRPDQLFACRAMKRLLAAINEHRPAPHKLRRSCAYLCCAGSSAQHRGWVFRNARRELLDGLPVVWV